MALAHLMHRSAHSASPRGVTIATPRLYEFTFELMTLGSRRATFRRLLNASGLQPGQRVLDVGCGTGYFARMLAQVPDTEVVGIDASPEMLGYANRHPRKPANSRFELGAAEALSYPDASFDVVVSSLFMHHVPPDLQANVVREMRRVLKKPGGRLLVAEVQLPERGPSRWAFELLGAAGMARHVPPLEQLAHDAGFTAIGRGQAAPWLFFVHATSGEPV